jgi:hypothetical protein
MRAVPPPKRGAALRGLPLLFRARSPGSRAVPPVARHARRHYLSWTFAALRHDLKPADPFAGDGSLRHRVPRAGFGYPLRDIHHRSSRHDKRAGASMGFTLQGFPLAAMGTPLGARALLPLPGAPRFPGGKRERPGLLQGLLPATSPCCHRNHKGPGRRSLPGVRPSRACSRPTWRSLWSWRLPSRPRAA